MINYITEEDLIKIQPYEAMLYSAEKRNTAIGVTKDIINLMADMCDKYITKVTRNYSCSKCKLQILQLLSPLYFKSMDHLENIKNQAETETETETANNDVEEIKTTKTTKRGRKAKKN